MTILEFKKQNKKKGVERGYYFKGEFLSRLKGEAIKILRERIEKVGRERGDTGDMSRDVWDKGKEVLPDVWEAIHHEWNLDRKRVKKINETNKAKREQEKIRAIPFKIQALKEDIAIYRIKINEKINEIKDFYGEKIKVKENSIIELEKQMKENEKRDDKKLN